MSTSQAPVSDLLKTSIFDRLLDQRYFLHFASVILGCDVALRVFHNTSLSAIEFPNKEISAGTILLYAVAGLCFFSIGIRAIRLFVSILTDPLVSRIERLFEQKSPDDDWVGCWKAKKYAWANKDTMLLKALDEADASRMRAIEWNDLWFGFSLILLASLWCQGPLLGVPWLAAREHQTILITRLAVSAFATWRLLDSLRSLSDYFYYVCIPGHPLAEEQRQERQKRWQEERAREITSRH